MERKKITFDLFIRGILIAALVIGVLYLLKRLSGVLLPFFVAWVLAYFIFPLVTFIQYKLKLKFRVASIACALILLALVGAGLFYLLVPPLLQEVGRLKNLVAEYLTSEVHQGNTPALLSTFIDNHMDSELVYQIFKEDNLLDAARLALPRLGSLLAESISLLSSLFSLVLVLLYTIFILLDYENLSGGWSRLVPPKYRTTVVRLLTDIKDGMNKYFRGQAFVALCVGILFSIGFLIIDFPLAIGLGLFIGALNMVPYLQVVGFIPTLLLAILKAADTGQNFWVIIASALVVFAVVQFIQDVFLVPRIMGRITGLSPAIILLSLSIWGSLMGMLGLIIALPVTTLLISYYHRYIVKKEKIPPLQPLDEGGAGS